MILIEKRSVNDKNRFISLKIAYLTLLVSILLVNLFVEGV